jgi:hypothetical protein
MPRENGQIGPKNIVHGAGYQPHTELRLADLRDHCPQVPFIRGMSIIIIFVVVEMPAWAPFP